VKNLPQGPRAKTNMLRQVMLLLVATLAASFTPVTVTRRPAAADSRAVISMNWWSKADNALLERAKTLEAAHLARNPQDATPYFSKPRNPSFAAQLSPSAMSTAQAAAFMKDPQIAEATPEEKAAYLLELGVPSTVVDSVTCVAPDPVSGSAMTAAQAALFMKDPAIDAASLEEKVAFLKAKGVPDSTIDSVTCVAP